MPLILALINDDRVISIEGFNARDLTVDFIGNLVDLIVCDVSFISQSFIIEVAKDLLKSEGIYIGLIKPQFEVGKSKIGKGGIVKEPKYRLEAIKKIMDCAKENGLKCFAFIKSPIFGGDGNVEYVAAFAKTDNTSKNEIPFAKIKQIVYEFTVPSNSTANLIVEKEIQKLPDGIIKTEKGYKCVSGKYKITLI